MPKSNDDLTKQDLEKTLEAHAKTIELQILISQQQNKLEEHLALCLEKVKEIDTHFSNGFRSEIKNHISQEIRDIRTTLEEIRTKLGKTEGALDLMKAVQEKIEEIDRRTWQQMWIWGGIALFTLANAVILIVGLWQNAWIIRS
jgi:hypothetical protein